MESAFLETNKQFLLKQTIVDSFISGDVGVLS